MKINKGIIVRAAIILALGVVMAVLFSYKGALPPVIAVTGCIVGVLVIWAVWRR